MATSTVPSAAARTLSPRAFMRFAVASLIGLIAIIPSGGLVRLTGSGLGCPDWPGCHGEVIPPMTGHAAIEYSNRVLSFLIVVGVVVTWFAARRVQNSTRNLRRWAGGAALASVGQGPLGGLTVLTDLHPVMVASHFLLSIVALGAGVVTVLLGRDLVRGIDRPTDPTRAKVAGAMLAMLCAVIVTGVLVTSSGPHTGDSGVTRRFWNLSAAAAVHVRVVIAFVVVGILFMVWLKRAGRIDPLFRRLAPVFTVLLIAQIIVGEYQYRNQLPWEVIVVHVTLAGLLFAVGVAIAWQIGHPTERPAAQSDRSALHASSTAEA